MMLRPATKEDALDVWQTHVASVRKLCIPEYTREQVEAWIGQLKPADYLSAIKEHRLFVSVINGSITGFGEFKKETIKAIYVHPSFTRRGIGTGLFRLLINKLKQRGIHYTRWNASLPSVPFYVAMGAIPEKTHQHVLSSGVEIPCIQMIYHF